jgi:hypothetical protein
MTLTREQVAGIQVGDDLSFWTSTRQPTGCGDDWVRITEILGTGITRSGKLWAALLYTSQGLPGLGTVIREGDNRHIRFSGESRRMRDLLLHIREELMPHVDGGCGEDGRSGNWANGLVTSIDGLLGIRP